MWCGVVWCGVVWLGVVWCGVVWCGVVWCRVAWRGVAAWRGGVAWRGVVWCGVVLCGVLSLSLSLSLFLSRGVAVVWRSCGSGVAVVWRSCGGGVAVLWRWCGGIVAVVWRSCGCGVAVVWWWWCGSNMKSVYLNPYVFNVERASADAPRGSMKYQLTYLNIRLFKCGYRTYIYTYVNVTYIHWYTVMLPTGCQLCLAIVFLSFIQLYPGRGLVF